MRNLGKGVGDNQFAYCEMCKATNPHLHGRKHEYIPGKKVNPLCSWMQEVPSVQ